MKVVNIKGSNGSGKTTIIKQMFELCDATPIYDAVGKQCATMFADIGWAAVGRYEEHKAMGGCDTLPSVSAVKDVVNRLACANFDLYGVVFEGMMISTIKTTFYDFLLDLENEHSITPIFVILNATSEGCIRRINSRGTARPNLNHDNVRHKCEQVIRHAKGYDPWYVRWLDVEDTPEQDMLATFLKLVGDDDLLSAMMEEA